MNRYSAAYQDVNPNQQNINHSTSNLPNISQSNKQTIQKLPLINLQHSNQKNLDKTPNKSNQQESQDLDTFSQIHRAQTDLDTYGENYNKNRNTNLTMNSQSSLKFIDSQSTPSRMSIQITKKNKHPLASNNMSNIVHFKQLIPNPDMIIQDDTDRKFLQQQISYQQDLRQSKDSLLDWGDFINTQRKPQVSVDSNNGNMISLMQRLKTKQLMEINEYQNQQSKQSRNVSQMKLTYSSTGEKNINSTNNYRKSLNQSIEYNDDKNYNEQSKFRLKSLRSNFTIDKSVGDLQRSRSFLKMYNVNKSQSRTNQQTENFVSLNIDRTDSTLKRKFIQPYKPDSNYPISDIVKESDHQKYLSYVAKNLSEIRYDVDKSISEATNLFKHLDYSDQHKNDVKTLFHKGTIFRSKLQNLNDNLTETISKNTASVIINQHLSSGDIIDCDESSNNNSNQKNYKKLSSPSKINVSRYKQNALKHQNKILREIGVISHLQEERNLKSQLKLDELQIFDPKNTLDSKDQDHKDSVEVEYPKSNNQKNLYNLTKKELANVKFRIRIVNKDLNLKNKMDLSKSILNTSQDKNQQLQCDSEGILRQSYYDKAAVLKGIDKDLSFPRLSKLGLRHNYKSVGRNL